MLGKIINRLLYKYDSSTYITRNRARFILYLILAIIIITPLFLLYFSYIHLYDFTSDYEILINIIRPVFIAFTLSFVMLIILYKGHFSLAGNLLLIIW